MKRLSSILAILLLTVAQVMAIDLTVVIEGTTNSNASVYYNGVRFRKGAVISADDDCERSDFTPNLWSGYRAKVTLDRAAKTVTATYASIIEYSTADAPVWYQIKFDNSGAAIAEQGEGAVVRTVASNTSSDSQLWRFEKTGTTTNKFRIISKSGYYMSLTSASQNTKVTATATDPGTTNGAFKYLYKSATKAYELTRYGDTSMGFNQLGGAGTGKEIGLWNTGDGGNALYFYPVAESEDIDITEFSITGASSFAVPNPHTLWYKTSAKATGVANPWMEYALPIGNGELGAMIFGSVCQDEIQFNEKTLWAGSPTIGSGYGCYRNFGSLLATILNRDDVGAATKYTRYLDIEEGVAGVNFTGTDGTQYTRRYISSAPDQVIAIQYKAVGGKKMNMRFTLSPGQSINASEVSYDDGMGIFTGSLNTVNYAARFQVSTTDGSISTSDNGVDVKDATEITVYLKGATNFNGNVADINQYSDGRTAAQVSKSVKQTIAAATQKGYDAVYGDHVSDFRAWTDRMSFSMGLKTPTRDTKALVDYFNNNKGATTLANDVLFLEELYFAYGRYLEISSNRLPIAAPNNLQGIWNDKANAPWNSDIHANINVQMNYWPAESTNLSELHVPFLNYTIRNAQGDTWKQAATQYGKTTHGWTFFTENNIFGGMSTWGNNYFVANAWNTSHLWQHWRYTQDREFLKQAFPVMWTAAQFWMDRLIKDRTVYDGTWVAPDEYSPEQNDHPKEDGTAHAQQIITYLFQNIHDAMEVLTLDEAGITQAELDQLNSYLRDIDKGLAIETYTGKWGTRNGVTAGQPILREWKYATYDVSNDAGHRHLSHLMALFPLEQIDKESEYFQPALNSLNVRGDEATGWSLGWKVNLWARALDGDHAHTIIKNALKHSTSYGTDQYAGGIYYNLFDSHAPFQIDGNFGTCSGIAEMLMQSAHDYIHIMPAIPTQWKQGEVHGMKAVGNFTVDFQWTGGNCTSARIVSNAGVPLRVRCERGSKSLKDAWIAVNGQLVSVTADLIGIVTIPCQKGDVIDINFVQDPTGVNTINANPSEAVGTQPIYDLSGRRLTTASDGRITIQGGKKSFVR